MAKKRKGGRRGFRFGKWVNLTFKILGAVVASGPAIKSVQENLSNPGRIPAGVLYHYSGFNVDAPSQAPNTAELATGIASVIGGIALMKLGGFIARRV